MGRNGTLGREAVKPTSRQAGQRFALCKRMGETG